MSPQTAISIMSLLIAGLSLLYTGYREVTKKSRDTGSEFTGMMVKLENIQNGITEIKSDLRGVKADVQELRERLVKVEQSASSLHHRVDRVEGKYR